MNPAALNDEHGPCPRMRMALRTLHWPPLGDHGSLLDRIRSRATSRGKRLLLSTSYVGGYLPCDHNTDSQSRWPCSHLGHFDYVNIHGEGHR